MIRVISPNHVIEGVILCQGGIAVSVITNTAAVGQSDHTRQYAPAGKQEVFAPGLLAYPANHTPERLFAISVTAPEEAAVAVITLKEEVTEGIKLKVAPAVLPETAVDG